MDLSLTVFKNDTKVEDIFKVLENACFGDSAFGMYDYLVSRKLTFRLELGKIEVFIASQTTMTMNQWLPIQLLLLGIIGLEITTCEKCSKHN